MQPKKFLPQPLVVPLPLPIPMQLLLARASSLCCTGRIQYHYLYQSRCLSSIHQVRMSNAPPLASPALALALLTTAKRRDQTYPPFLERVVTRHHQKASPKRAVGTPCAVHQASLIAKTVGTTPAPQTQQAAPTYGYTLAPAKAPQRTSPTPIRTAHPDYALAKPLGPRPCIAIPHKRTSRSTGKRPHKPATGTAARAPESHNRTAMQDTHMHIAHSSKLTANTHHQATPRPPPPAPTSIGL